MFKKHHYRPQSSTRMAPRKNKNKKSDPVPKQVRRAVTKAEQHDKNREAPLRKTAAYPRKRPGVVIPECTHNYGLALSNPFKLYEKEADVCVPDDIVVPSLKTRSLGKFIVSTSSSGFGGIIAGSSCPANDLNGICYTTASGTTPILGTQPINSSDGTNWEAFNWTTPYNGTNFAVSSLLSRCVGWGIRITYAGTALNRGGTITTALHPQNQALSSYSPDAIAQMPYAQRYQITDEPVTMIWKPNNETVLEYNYDFNYGPHQPPDSGGIAQSERDIWVGIRVPASVGAVEFTVEVVAFWEVIGDDTAIDVGTSRSHSDPVGFGAIQSSVDTVGNSFQGPPVKHERSFFERVGDAIASASSWVVDHADTIKNVALAVGALLI